MCWLSVVNNFFNNSLSLSLSLSLQVDSGVVCSPVIENPEGLDIATRRRRKRKRSTPSYVEMTSDFVRQLRQAEEIPTDNILVGVAFIFDKIGVHFVFL